MNEAKKESYTGINAVPSLVDLETPPTVHNGTMVQLLREHTVRSKERVAGVAAQTCIANRFVLIMIEARKECCTGFIAVPSHINPKNTT